MKLDCQILLLHFFTFKKKSAIIFLSMLAEYFSNLFGIYDLFRRIRMILNIGKLLKMILFRST